MQKNLWYCLQTFPFPVGLEKFAFALSSNSVWSKYIKIWLKNQDDVVEKSGSDYCKSSGLDWEQVESKLITGGVGICHTCFSWNIKSKNVCKTGKATRSTSQHEFKTCAKPQLHQTWPKLMWLWVNIINFYIDTYFYIVGWTSINTIHKFTSNIHIHTIDIVGWTSIYHLLYVIYHVIYQLFLVGNIHKSHGIYQRF